MNDKRDKVFSEAVDILRDCGFGQTVDETPIPQIMTDFALSRETELRRQIADRFSELREGHKTEGYLHCTCDGCGRLVEYINELRGNK